jgi:nicotinamide riboside transporter PnuC
MSLHSIIEIVSGAATIIAIAGVILNNRRRLECFYLWFVSNGLSLAVHACCGLWAMTARDAVFFILAVHGLYSWKVVAGSGEPVDGKNKRIKP